MEPRHLRQRKVPCQPRFKQNRKQAAAIGAHHVGRRRDAGRSRQRDRHHTWSAKTVAFVRSCLQSTTIERSTLIRVPCCILRESPGIEVYLGFATKVVYHLWCAFACHVQCQCICFRFSFGVNATVNTMVDAMSKCFCVCVCVGSACDFILMLGLK